MNLTEMESKVRSSSYLSDHSCPHSPNRCEKPQMETRGERRQASCKRLLKAHITSRLLGRSAQGMANRASQQLNEIMPLIYKRFTDKTAEESRQIYKVRLS